MQLPSRKFFLMIVIGLLAVSALLGIFAIITSGFGDLGNKVLETTGELDVAAILALCCAGKSHSALHRVTQLLGFAAIAITLVLFQVITWVTGFDSWGLWRAVGVGSIVSVACAHAGLILPLMSYNRISDQLVKATIACIAIVAVLLANYLIFPNFDPGDAYVKTIAVFLILDVLGTIVLIILRKATKPDVEIAAPVVGSPATPALVQPDNSK